MTEQWSFRTIEVSDPRYELAGLRHVTVKSPALRGRADITLFIPNSTSPSPSPSPSPPPSPFSMPLVILLHGVYGSHWSWAFQGGAHMTARSLIERQEIAPVVIAMPSDGLWGDGSGYVRHAEQDFERWIVEEVPKAAATVLDHSEPYSTSPSPSPSQWSAVYLCGLSMGGFGALRLGAKYHHVFHGISAHSPLTRFAQLQERVQEDLSSYDTLGDELDVLPSILAHRAHLPPLRFDCGTDDPLIEYNRELHRQLTEAGVPHLYQEFAGGHDWHYWHDHLEDSLRFFHEITHGGES